MAVVLNNYFISCKDESKVACITKFNYNGKKIIDYERAQSFCVQQSCRFTRIAKSEKLSLLFKSICLTFCTVSFLINRISFCLSLPLLYYVK